MMAATTTMAPITATAPPMKTTLTAAAASGVEVVEEKQHKGWGGTSEDLMLEDGEVILSWSPRYGLRVDSHHRGREGADLR